uniref:Rho GTPase activating protein 5 n=1 Tax=Eptatretus burgeri TaxID=7764 RepID=A0A8C4R674_EPTBU
MSKNKEARTINVSVLGLSGADKEKGSYGVGKSCLCNRFVRPRADDYHPEHTSILSQIDFSGRVVNNDHFLYWGRGVRLTDDGQELVFHVVEQTEFIDDATFTAYRCSSPQHYVKRAAATKLSSAEKLMYICTDQLGIEQDFEQIPMPEGKLLVDGFLVCVDVSQTIQRPGDDQLRFLEKLVAQLVKTKKPVVLVATKCDRQDERYVREVQAFAAGKKVGLPLVETSAQQNINVSAAFLALAQLVEKAKGKIKFTPYIEAARQAQEMMQNALCKYETLLGEVVGGHSANWRSAIKELKIYPQHQQLTDLVGLRKAEQLFVAHVQRLRAEHVLKKGREYSALLPRAFLALFDDLGEVQSLSWPDAMSKLSRKNDFSSWFVKLPDHWSESKHLDSADDHRIPVDFLKDNGVVALQVHISHLQVLHHKNEMKPQLLQAMEASNVILPGKAWEDVQSLFQHLESFHVLSDQERLAVFQEYQKRLMKRAQVDYQELLLERAEIFADVSKRETLNQDSKAEIDQLLESDSRYKALRWASAERDMLIFKHVCFVHHPLRELCYAQERCIDNEVEVLFSEALPCLVRQSQQSLINFNSADRLTIVVFGRESLPLEFAAEIKRQSTGGEYALNGKAYELEVRMIDGDAAQLSRLLQSMVAQPGGCVCVFNSLESLNFIMDSLGRAGGTLGSKMPAAVSVVLMLTNKNELTNRRLPLLRQQAQQAANKLQVSFVDCPDDMLSGVFHKDQVRQVISILAKALPPSALSVPMPRGDATDFEPDVTVAMCLMCGDSFSLEDALAPFFEFCYPCFPSLDEHLNLRVSFDGQQLFVRMAVLSYHGATLRKLNSVHGFALLYSAKRRASLAALRSLLGDITDVYPVLLVAVTDSSSEFFENELTKELVSEGNHIATEIGAKFAIATTQSQFHRQLDNFKPFFADVMERKAAIEEFWKQEPSIDSMSLGSGAFNSGAPLSQSSPSDSDEEEALPAYSLASEDTQLLPVTVGRGRALDLEGNSITCLPTNPPLAGHDVERIRRSLPPARMRPTVDRPQVNKLDPKLIEKINDTIGRWPERAVPYGHAVGDGDCIEMSQDAGKFRSKAWLFSRSHVAVNGSAPPGDSDCEIGVLENRRNKPKCKVRRHSSYRFRSRTLLRKQVYPSDVIRQHAALSEGSEDEQTGAAQIGEGLRPRRKKGSDSDPLLCPFDAEHVGIDNPAAEFDEAGSARGDGKKKKKGDKGKRKDKLKAAKAARTRAKKAEKTYFGLPLQELVHSPDRPVPLFVEKCVEFIETNGLNTEGLYRVSGNKADQENLQLIFEKDNSVDFAKLNISVHSVTGVLKSFFTGLDEPLLPYDIQKELTQAVSLLDEQALLDALRNVLRCLPPANLAVFTYIVKHLHRVFQHSNENKMNCDNLSICFWPTLMKPNFTDMASITATLVGRTPIQPFIQYCPVLFLKEPGLHAASPLQPINSTIGPPEACLIDLIGSPPPPPPTKHSPLSHQQDLL